MNEINESSKFVVDEGVFGNLLPNTYKTELMHVLSMSKKMVERSPIYLV